MRKTAISVPREEKLFWIGKHLRHFEIVDQTYKHPKINDVAKRLANVIRSDFNYSCKTLDCDLVWTWLGIYREHKLELKKQNKMSKSFHHETLKERIKSVFSNAAYEDQWDILMEMFPEIYQEWSDEKFDRQHMVGHVYMRIEQSSKRVVSILMPVVMPPQLPYPTKDAIKILNLITGKFWDTMISIDKDQKVIPNDLWYHLVHKMSNEGFIHLGEFSHSQHSCYLQGQHEPFILHEEPKSK